MAYTVLARKYRSQNFDEVVGQDHVAKTLKRAIETGRIAQAFLFTGTRGTGKTSMARILAKSLNCLKSPAATTTPCLECDSCKSIARGDDIDVIEIDAASNTQVEKTREVILDNAAYRPARARFKIYIIDEVHMLSKASFNALLKTLEEPPEHVKFILATTEAEKVLQTILSRCQRYDFRNIPTREIAGHLKAVCAGEGIEADDDALLLVAKAGAGSMRDSLSLLDRLLSIGEKRLSVDMIEQLLGLPKAQLMFDLAQAIGEGNVKGVLSQSTAMITRGLSADSLVASLVDHLRNLLILRTCGADSELVEVPGIAVKDLAAQADRFDAVNLTQDITILEELRRHMRQSQAGRALLDATLVRLTLAEQFTPVAEILARVGGASPAGNGDGAQKKNYGSAGVGGAGAPPVRDHAPAGAPPVTPVPTPIIAAPPAVVASPPAEAVSPVVAQAPVPSVSSVPTVSAPPALTFDDEDDDLPRPGKVWDNSGPSLKELLAQRQAADAAAASDGASPAAAPAASDPAFTNIEPVGHDDLGGVWKALLDLMSGHGPALHSLLSNGSFGGVEDGSAVIRYSKKNETFTKLLERNGKKDLVREAFTKVLGKPVGVRFVVDESMGDADAPPSAATPPRGGGPPAGHARPAPPSRAAAPPEPQAPAGPPAIRVTPELVEQMKQAPLVASVMEAFNATPVKVE
jgi:DNA polymerase-3 subunit gamma/tau